MLRKLSNPVEALDAYDEVLHLYPASAEACCGKGWAHIALNRFEDALAMFEQAIQLDPLRSDPYAGKQSIFFHLHDEKEEDDVSEPAEILATR